MGIYNFHYKRHFKSQEELEDKLRADGILKDKKKSEATKPEKEEKKKEDK